jgi:NAD(P)H dehydrogenase (quinone)
MGVKISVLYFSASGNTQKAAEFIKRGLLSVSDTEVKLMNIASAEEIDNDFINGSGAVIFGTPTYAANMCWQMKQFFDTYKGCKLAGKIGAAFATENYVYGGGDIALLGIMNHLLVKGMLGYSSGVGCGQPIIHLGPVAVSDTLDEKKELFVIFGKRIADKAKELFA